MSKCAQAPIRQFALFLQKEERRDEHRKLEDEEKTATDV
jgi:hypothetical protein